ncbi:MAG TPA: energy transducer TonB [Candidatus Acidoferrum sp.]|nr:energy transducer TonB [Candidatus Acidoferrum sp.]
MSDSARIIQTTALEVPVTIQGSQVVEGTDRREMFTETTRTSLVFESGASVLLKARVQAGQSVFLRNELTGKEVLCKVIEVPPAGQPGPTELEFTVREPGFWDAPSEQPAQPAQESGTPQSPTEHALVGSGVDPSAPTTPSVTAPNTLAVPPSSPSQESGAAPAGTVNGAEPDHAKEAEQLAAMVAKEAKAQARRASTVKAVKETAVSDGHEGQTASGSSVSGKTLSPLELRLHGIRTYTLRGSRSALAAVAFVLVIVAVGVAWHLQGHRSTHPISRPSAAVPHSSAAATVTPATQGTQPSSTAAEPGVQLVKNATAASVRTDAAQPSRSPEPAIVASTPLGASRTVRGSAPLGAQPEALKKPGQSVAKHIIPARILSQTQPPLPSWAKALDVSDVVTLDAVIDERGNVASATLLSGPRLLERAAKDAIQLWVFEPTLANGKPIPTHMVLTVEFQQ